MRIENKLIIFIYRMILIIIGAIAVVFNCLVPDNKFNSDILFYFTVQSNILIILILLYMIIKEFLFKAEFTRAMYIIKSITMVIITITCLVYTFILMPVVSDIEEFAVGTFHNICLHFVIPIGYFLDYLLFDEKGCEKWYNPFLDLIYPALYAVMVFVRASKLDSTVSNRYIYPFLDVDMLGLTQVAQNILAAIVAVIVLGFIYFGLDKLLGLFSRKKVEVIDTNYFLRH